MGRRSLRQRDSTSANTRYQNTIMLITVTRIAHHLKLKKLTPFASMAKETTTSQKTAASPSRPIARRLRRRMALRTG